MLYFYKLLKSGIYEIKIILRYLSYSASNPVG